MRKCANVYVSLPFRVSGSWGMASLNGGDLPATKRARLETTSLGEPETEEEGMARSRVALLLCGSFSPITNMHLRMMGEAQMEIDS